MENACARVFCARIARCAWDPWVWACGELRLRGVLQAVERGACSVERAPHTKQKKDT